MADNRVNGAGEITAMLASLREGETAARDRLVEAVYAQLKQIAAAQLRRERPNHTLQPTALVHEACMRLLEGTLQWENREHLFRTGAKIMRQILTDYARRKQAQKRDGERVFVEMAELTGAPHSWKALDLGDILALDESLEKLKSKDPRQALVVELRFFVGMTEAEIAEVLQLSERTVKREWEMARAWLYGQLKSGGS